MIKFQDRMDKYFHIVENGIYLVISTILLATVAILVYDVILKFIFIHDNLVREIVEIIDNTLLILMVVEILYTIRVSVREHTLCAEPFIIVAMIASIRRILLISVESAYMTDNFQHNMIEISILGLLIFIFSISIILMHKKTRPGQFMIAELSEEDKSNMKN